VRLAQTIGRPVPERRFGEDHRLSGLTKRCAAAVLAQAAGQISKLDFLSIT
jgi:hypothetical protein